MRDNGRLLVYDGQGWGAKPPSRPLVICGSHSATRELAPWDDLKYEIWLFNEAAQKPSVYKRWDALLQIHQERVYASPTNWVNKDHWEWLQQDHGPDKRIFMQDRDERVPNSVKYPLDEVLEMIKPLRYLRSSPAMSLALAIYLGYKEIWLYGSELSSGTEYAYQAINYAFWIGFAKGRGVDLHLECWQSEFERPIYGYEGEPQIDPKYYAERAEQHYRLWKSHDSTVQKLRDRINQAMMEHDYIKTGELSLNLETALQSAGEAFGAMSEAERYAKREDMISRQEYERTAGYALIDGDAAHKDMLFCGGKCEFVWNAWKSSGRLDHLNVFRGFLEEKNKHAYTSGVKTGIYRENIHYQSEYDKVVQALGGTRAIHHLQPMLPEVVAA